MTVRAGSREPLTRQRVLAAAVALADDRGIAAVTMRSLAQRLGVEAMSLYHHVPGKDALLDGMVDLVFDEIAVPDGDGDWQAAIRGRAMSARDVLRRHPWAIGLLDSRRAPGPSTLRHNDAVLGRFRAAGFSLPMAAHAISVVDSYVYGFALQELSLPFTSADDVAAVADGILADLPDGAYPNLVAMIAEHALAPGFDFGDEYRWGLDLILDALERANEARR